MRSAHEPDETKPTHEEEDRKGRYADSPTPERPIGERGGSLPDNSLTPREVEILRLVVRGRTNQQIARTLSISVSTVKRHLTPRQHKAGGS